jgi:peptidoglycan-associated lipoprotein
MARRSWYFSGPLGMLLLGCVLAGCARQLPLLPGPEGGGQAMVRPVLPATGDQPPAAEPGRLEERDRSAIEGRMSGDRAAPDAEAARETFLNVDVLFAYNSFTLTEEARRLLEQKARWLVRHPGVTVQLEGHCDERGTVAYNLALGERRANAVRQYMTALGVSAARMTTISYGEEFPLDLGHDEEAWARNRRAHFAILNP